MLTVQLIYGEHLQIGEYCVVLQLFMIITIVKQEAL